MGLGALAFLNPWLLGALAALPLIYLLLRTVPPRPRQIAFPATRILVGIENKEKTPDRTPWWLMLIRMLAAALVILALAEPVLNPDRETALKGRGPVVLVVDNGWASAAQWALRTRMIDRLIAEAEGQSRAVVAVATAGPPGSVRARIEAPGDARTTAAAFQPQPYAPRREAVATALGQALAGAGGRDASVVWLTDGIDHERKAREFADALAAIAGAGFAVIEAGPGEEALGVVAGLSRDGKLGATVVRATGGAREGTLHALSARSQRLGEVNFRLDGGATATRVEFELPLELRNQVTRIEIASERSAGAVSLLDARSQWHRIGLISGASEDNAQPLLGPLYYIERALGPYAELINPKGSNIAASLDEIFKRNASVTVLADVGTLAGEVRSAVEEWVKKGGVLVRFAGPRLENGGDDLVPVALRLGGRTLGGALSWSTPQPLAKFTDDSLFAGLVAPADVLVRRQVLADPTRLGPEVRVWARLADGTPLVTASRLGEGQIVLFHVTANSDWSNLPLSGLFVEMLRRIATLGPIAGAAEAGEAGRSDAAAGSQESAALAPINLLDGFGQLRPPPPNARAITIARFADVIPDAEHPPGYYGAKGSPRALNIVTPKTELAPLPALPASSTRRAYEGQTAMPLKPWMLAAALALLLIDVLAVLLLQAGSLGWRRRPAQRGAATATAIAGACLLLAVSGGERASAQEARLRAGAESAGDTAVALRATSKVTFGYVQTGNTEADEASRTGLSGLVKVLIARTAVEPGEPIGVDVRRDEIAFFPILYWPVLPNAQALDTATLAKVDAYMKQGGMLIFDTRDYGQGLPSGLSLRGGEGGTALQRLLGRLDIPRLEPVPEGHVLTKSFYLLRTFPGRWDGGQMWVEAEAPEGSDAGRKARRSDGVSSILVTSNDLAAAWALDDANRPLYPVVPGGEAQREQAFRTGVNIVMYALTGNYKADQVHVPALLDRLGQ